MKKIITFRNIKGNTNYELKVISRPKNVLMKF